MIIVIIICGILYLFMIYGVILLYYTYNKDYNELEYRILQLEKRTNNTNKELKGQVERFDFSIENIWTVLENELPFKNREEGDNMACKKGRGGRKK